MKKAILFLISTFILFPIAVFANQEISTTLTINCEVVSVLALKINYPKLSERIAYEGENFSLNNPVPEISYSCTDKCLLQINEEEGVKVVRLSSDN